MKDLQYRRLRGLAITLLALISLPALSNPGATPDISEPELLIPDQRHESIGQMVADFIEKRHYNQVSIDNDLSSVVHDNYLENLDRNRMYLLASDIEYFERYRYIHDDIIRHRPLEPAFEIYEVFLTRQRERMRFALTQLEVEPDYETDAEFQIDRTEAPWATSTDELDEIWRQRVVNDALGMALENEPWEKIQEVLSKRYNSYLRRLGQIKSDDVFERYMSSFARTIDPHSTYMSPRNADEQRIQMSLSYVGIGASLVTEDEYVKIVNIIRGGPAFHDGTLQRDDKITGVAQGPEGEMIDVLGWRLDDVVDLIRGPEASEVRLQIIPANSIPGSPREIVSLTRGPVKLEEQAAKSEVITVPREGRDWTIGVVDVPAFYRDYRALTQGELDFTSVTKDVKKLITELEDEGIDGLIVDLRGNSGGHLQEATALSGLFIANGPIVQFRDDIDTRRSPPQRLDDPDPVARVAWDGPLVVLVDRFSASASEIFAGAIQDYNRGVIVGQQTYGKGTVQNLYSLDQYFRIEGDKGLGQLTLTVGKYYRVTGESTQHRGVHPDIALPSAVDHSVFGESARDNALPWDTIDTTSFRPDAPQGSEIESLLSSHSERAKSDPNFQYQVSRIQVAEEARDQKTISLNINTRRSERDQQLQKALEIENARRDAVGLEPVESLDDIESEEFPDVELDQASKIVTDLAIMREVIVTPETTARNSH